MLQLTPVSTVGIDFTLSTGKDDYAGADSSQEFGLLDNKNTSFTLGANYTDIGENFDPELGFAQRTDMVRWATDSSSG